MTHFHLKSKIHSDFNSACFSGKSILAGMLLTSVVFSANAQDTDRDLTATEEGIHNGFYYNLWINRSGGNDGDVTFGLREAGRYTAQWNENVRWLGGIGWNSGSRNKTLRYSGKFNPGLDQGLHGSNLALNAWPENLTTFYYIVETYGHNSPVPCLPLRQGLYGSVQSDGGTYDIITCKYPGLPRI